MVALALAVGLSSLAIGTILSTALLVGPAATALRLTRRMGGALVLAAAIGVGATWAGVLLAYDSYYWGAGGNGWPVSFFIVAAVFITYLVSGLPAVRALRRPRLPSRPCRPATYDHARTAVRTGFRGRGGHVFAAFMINAWVIATIVGVVAGVIGFFVVLRGSAFAAHAIPNGAFAGAAGANLVGLSSLLGLAVFSLLAALGIGSLGRRGRHDVVTALALVMMLALGALFLSRSTEYEPEIYSLLFGEILGVSTAEILPVALLGARLHRRQSPSSTGPSCSPRWSPRSPRPNGYVATGWSRPS